MQDFGSGLLLLVYSRPPSPIIEIIPAGSFFCAFVCLYISSPLEILQATTDDICPWSDYRPVNTHTLIHIHIDAHGHINHWRHHLFSQLTLPYLAGPWTWQRSDISLLSAQYSCGASDQKSDRIEFYYSHNAHEWRRHSLLGTNKDSREKKYKHLRCDNVNNLWHLMWVNVKTSNSSSVSDTQLQPDPDFMFCFCRYCSSHTAIQNKCLQFTFMLKLYISSCASTEQGSVI